MIFTDPINRPIKEIAEHHPWITGHIEMKKEYWYLLKPLLRRIRKAIRKPDAEVASWTFAVRQDPPIVCVWVDVGLMPHREALAVEYQLYRLAAECGVASWWNQENNKTRFSIWQTLPDDVYEYLLEWDEEWCQTQKEMI